MLKSSTIKKFTIYNYLGLILLVLLFGISFLITKKILYLLKRRIQTRIPLFHEKKRVLYFLFAVESIIDFALDNFKLLSVWFFIYLHVFFDFRYLFSLLQPVANSYSITLFYLASIPILVYLSSQLISNIKALNQRLSFLFFTERSQSKFIFLITSIL